MTVPYKFILRDRGNRAFGAYDQSSAGGIGTDGVELEIGLFVGADAGGVLWWAEIVDEFRADEEEAVAGLVFILILVRCALAIVGYGGVVGLRGDLG